MLFLEWECLNFDQNFTEIPKGPIDNIPSFVQTMAWRRTGAYGLCCRVTRSQWVKNSCAFLNGPQMCLEAASIHFNDVIMGTMASQITSLTIVVYSTVYSGADQRKYQSSGVIDLCVGNSPVTGEFPAQMVSNAENVSIWWRHHVWEWCCIMAFVCYSIVNYEAWLFSIGVVTGLVISMG